MITSGNGDKAVLGFLLSAAVATSAPISKALPGFFNTLVAKFFASFSRNPSKCLKKLHNPATIKLVEYYHSQSLIFFITNRTLPN